MSRRYVRFQSPTLSDRGLRVGVFGLLNVLGRSGQLSTDDEAYRVRQNRWFEDAFTDPSTVDPSVYDERVNPNAVAWFKTDASAHLVAALDRHLDILDDHGVTWERVESEDPGRVVYEDDWQVVVVPTDDVRVTRPLEEEMTDV